MLQILVHRHLAGSAGGCATLKTWQTRQVPISIRVSLEIWLENYSLHAATEKLELEPQYNIRLTQLYKSLKKTVAA
jgi:hypothetical protein